MLFIFWMFDSQSRKKDRTDLGDILVWQVGSMSHLYYWQRMSIRFEITFYNLNVHKQRYYLLQITNIYFPIPNKILSA